MEPSDQVEIVEIVDGATTWRFDATFLRSTWHCIWGRGCQGIDEHPAPELMRGCCSVGAELDGIDEAKMVAALAATIEPSMFQFHATAAQDGVFADAVARGIDGVERRNTRVVDGACIFLNRPGFSGGAGCALHLAAEAFGESPIEWKPSVCWQLPIKVDVDDDGAREVATVRRWTRADWGPEGQTMAWCCTEVAETYTADAPVIDTLADELRELTGETVFVELRRRIAGDG